MSTLKKLASRVGVPAVLALSGLSALAQVRPPTITPTTRFTKSDLVDTITTFANYLLVIIGLIAVILIVYGGYLYITAGGDEENLKKARNTLVYGVIGVVVAILAFAIVSFAASFLS